ncbi:MAG: acyl-CoA thioesterase [Candidatus Spyradosoma sp.]
MLSYAVRKTALPSPRRCGRIVPVTPKFHQLEDFAVRFAETDAAGVVHFSHFPRWAEDAECDFFRRNGLSAFAGTPAETRSGWPKVSLKIDYRAPARYADRIRVRIRPAAFPRPESRTIEWTFEILRVEKDGSLSLLAAGTHTSVFAEISPEGEMRAAKAVPADVRRALEAAFA